jgi:hypothetical protein
MAALESNWNLGKEFTAYTRFSDGWAMHDDSYGTGFGGNGGVLPGWAQPEEWNGNHNYYYSGGQYYSRSDGSMVDFGTVKNDLGRSGKLLEATDENMGAIGWKKQVPIIEVTQVILEQGIRIYYAKGDNTPIMILKNSKIDANIYLIKETLPIHFMDPFSLVYDIDFLIPDNIKILDAFFISLGGMAGFGEGIGATASLDIAFINRGEDEKKVFGYVSVGPGAVGGYSYGLSVGYTEWNDNSGVEFNGSTYEGSSLELTGSFGNASYTYIRGGADETWAYKTRLAGYNAPFGAKPSLGAFISDSTPLGQIGWFRFY